MGKISVAALCAIALSGSAAAQTPQPFPKPSTSKPAPTPPPADPAGQRPSVLPPTPATAPGPNDVPDEATLGVSVYPGAEFISSFDAGRGQRYYLFGTNATFSE